MDPLAIAALGPVSLSGLSALRPVQVQTVPTAVGGTPAGSTPLTLQGLAQSLFQQTLQTAALFPVAESARENLGLVQDATVSLLAALNAPQAAATPTPTPDAIPQPTARASLAPFTTPSPTVPPATVPADLPAIQDPFVTGSSLAFALQTALRFGAGVAVQALATPHAPELGTGLVRDAAAVPRLGSLQPHAGGPGPGAFTRPSGAGHRNLPSYPTTPEVGVAPGRLDLVV